MEVSPISARFLGGTSTPAIRAITLSLPLFMFRVGADDPDHALAVDDLALIANLFNRCAHFHFVSVPVILPRVQSCGDNSTRTRSPGRSRTQFRLTVPTGWARTCCLFSSSTR